jgi:hypothetical protein
VSALGGAEQETDQQLLAIEAARARAKVRTHGMVLDDNAQTVLADLGAGSSKEGAERSN